MRRVAQHTDVLHTRDDNDRISTGQVPQCRHERRARCLETFRDGMGAKACWTLDERVVLPTQKRHTDKVHAGQSVLHLEQRKDRETTVH